MGLTLYLLISGPTTEDKTSSSYTINISSHLNLTIKNLSVVDFEQLVNIMYAESAIISGVLDLPTVESPPNKFLTAAVAIAVLGQSVLHPIF